MRSLSFDTGSENGRDRFDVCLGALLLGEGFQKDRRKTAARVVRKLKEIADKIESGSGYKYELQSGGGIVLLEETEFSLLKERVDNQPWSGEAIERADECFDWLSGIPESKPAIVKDETNSK